MLKVKRINIRQAKQRWIWWLVWGLLRRVEPLTLSLWTPLNPGLFLTCFKLWRQFLFGRQAQLLALCGWGITLHHTSLPWDESLLHCLQWCFHDHVRLFTPWRHQTTRRLRKLAVRNGPNNSTVRTCPRERETSRKNPQKQKNDGKKNGVKSHTIAAKRAENEEQNDEPRQKGRTKKWKTTTR